MRKPRRSAEYDPLPVESPPSLHDNLTSYRLNASALNTAIQHIGMGTYQWGLFIVIGFGWASDNLWPIVTSLILTPVAYEFHVSNPPILTLAQNIGLLVGALFWGFGCDIFGRRWAFNLTIGLTAVFGLAAAASPSFATICIFAALWSIGVGGNLPVDSAIFLEFLPGSHQYLLTVLSAAWALAQLLANLVAWPILGRLTCPDPESCTKENNMGWRYFLIVMGGMALVMCLLRLTCFTLFESPKFLMGKGRYEEAVEVVHEVARRNGKTTSLSLDDLTFDADQHVRSRVQTGDILRMNLEHVNLSHVKALFDTPRRAWSTGLIITVWGLIGLGFPLYNAFLPYIQQNKGIEFGDGSTALTYRNSLIIATAGLPGSLIGGVLVELPYFGRKGAIFTSSIATGVFLLASTTATTSATLLGWNCAYSFTSSLLYAVLYAYTPEMFMTKDRGTGNALTAAANRIGGILAPMIALVADLNTSVPVYLSGGLFVVAGIVITMIEYESRGRASL